MLAQIYVYRDRRGKFRWNVSTNSGLAGDHRWNVVCQCTDAHHTISDAETQARNIVCRAWELDVEHDESCYRPFTFFNRLRQLIAKVIRKVL